MAKKEETPLDQAALDAILGSEADADPDSDYELSDEDLDTLSDAEREAYEAEQEAEAAQATAAAEAAAEAEAAANTPPAPDPEVVRAQQMQQAQREALAELQQKRGEADTTLRELNEQLLGGDLTEDEYNAKFQDALKGRDELNSKIAVAEYEASTAQRTADTAWEAATKAFQEAHPEFVSDAHFDGFNEVLGDVTENPRFANLPFAAQINLAAQQYAVQAQAMGHQLAFNPGAAPTTPQPQAQQQPQRPTPETRAPRTVPPTLAAIPSDSVDPHQSNLAQISARLETADWEESERIIASLPEHVAEQVLANG